MLKEYKSITEIVGPLMLVEGVNGVKYDELVEITARDGSIRLGKVLEVNGDKAMVQLFESAQGIQMSTSKARFLGKSLELAVSEDMLGRVFDGLGRPKDGGAPVTYYVAAWPKANGKIMDGVYEAEQTHPKPVYKDERQKFLADWLSGRYNARMAFEFPAEDVEELEIVEEVKEPDRKQATTPRWRQVKEKRARRKKGRVKA